MKANNSDRRRIYSPARAVALALTLTVVAAAGVLRPVTAGDVKPLKSRNVRGQGESGGGVTALLTNGTGDAHATVQVDPFGAFGNNLYGDGLVYDPVGPTASSTTTYDSALWFSGRGQAGEGGGGVFLAGATVYDPPLGGTSVHSQALISPPFTSTTTNQAVSTFTQDGFRFDLTQEMLPATEKGSIFRQTYVITNQGEDSSIDLLRTIDGDLNFDGTNDDRAGVSRDGQTLFEFDNGEDPSTPTTFVGIDLNGQADLGYRVAAYQFKDNVFDFGRAVLTNELTLSGGGDADTDGDGLTDVAYDITMTQGRTFTIPGGQSVTLVVNTILGDGTPAEQLGANVDLSGPDTTVPAGDTVCYSALVTGGESQPTGVAAAPVSGAEVLFVVDGSTGNADQQKVTTNADGIAQFCFRPLFPGGYTVTACLDTNGNGACDPGEPTDTFDGTAVAPTTNKGTATGQGGVTVGGGTGHFNFTAVGLHNFATGQMRFTAPAVGELPAIVARAQSIQSVEFGGGPGNKTVQVLGTARIQGGGIVPFRIDATDAGQSGGGDSFVITFLMELDGDNTPEAVVYGGSLKRVPGGRSDVVIRLLGNQQQPSNRNR